MEQEQDQEQEPALMEIISSETTQGAGAESGAWLDGPRQLGARAWNRSRRWSLMERTSERVLESTIAVARLLSGSEQA